MTKLIEGLHHITALTDSAQGNLDFYSGVLGLRLVKKTVNFDAPEVYHLYYGNEEGLPGTIMTFFPYAGIPRGRSGYGQLTVTSFSVPENSLAYWMKRLDQFNIAYSKPAIRFGDEEVLSFTDPDGLGLELVANKRDFRTAFTYGNIPVEFAIKGFYGVTLTLENHEKTADLLTNFLDHKFILEKNGCFRYSVTGDPGTYVDLLSKPKSLKGLPGAGTIHHVAFETQDGLTQEAAREKLLENGFHPTPIVDREYFESVYFREPGGVLFEIATRYPGFAVDEEPPHLGESLKLPSWQEPNRAFIERGLIPIKLDITKFRDR